MGRWILLCLLLLFCPAVADTRQPGEAECEAGTELFREGRYAEAREKFRQGLAIAPNDANLVYGVATTSLSLEDMEEARKQLLHYKEIEPDDWRGPAALIRVYQAIGDKAARDAERQTIYSLYKKANKADFPAHFWRDKFTAGEPARFVEAYEAFEFEGRFQAKYTFAVYENAEDEKPIGLIQVESMDADTEMARQLGQIGPDQRVYTLDWNGPDGHRTYDYFTAEPQYDDLKVMVEEILSGKRQPASSSTPVK